FLIRNARSMVAYRVESAVDRCNYLSHILLFRQSIYLVHSSLLAVNMRTRNPVSGVRPKQRIQIQINISPFHKLRLPQYPFLREVQPFRNSSAFNISRSASYLDPIQIQFPKAEIDCRLAAPCHPSAALRLFDEPVAYLTHPV